ncbi:uncharacterized protein LOC110846777 [Folsomia candida]|uniref:uncharacterized protein LOC110846777 n=1 Tax=Folsomia candida TaxID=158441 RepID=UPI000B8F294B|nr:uncharacterized protein LOC110846777 [Folsomia candida]
MAPPELGSQSEDSESSPLEYIEQTLRTLETNTLEIKKRNAKIIKNIRPCGSTSATASRGWKGSPIDVPPLIQSRALLNVDVEKILHESSKLKEKINETLRLSAENRAENQKYLEELRQESLQLSFSLPVGSSLRPSSSHKALTRNGNMGNGGILGSIKNVLSKLTPGGKVGGDKENVYNYELNTLLNSPPSPAQLIPASFEETDHNASTMPPPPPSPTMKPRIKRSTKELPTLNHPTPRPRVSRSKIPPPPQPQAPRPTFELQDLRNMCDKSVTSDEEVTIATPIPKPRSTLIRQGSSISESSSEFEYFDTPLIFETMQILDSDESLIIPLETNEIKTVETINAQKSVKKFQKNHQSTKQIPKQYKQLPIKPDIVDECIVQHANFPVSQQSAQKPKNKVRPSSPPPPTSLSVIKLASGTPLAQCHWSEEDSSISSTEDEATELLLVHNIAQQPNVETNDSKTSALQFGVPVPKIDVPIRPWIEEEPSTKFKIQTSPFHNIEESPQQTSPKNIPVSADMDQKIQDEFAFLYDVEKAEDDTNLSENKCMKEDKSQQSTNGEIHRIPECLYQQMVDIVTETISETNHVNFVSTSIIYPTFENVEECLLLLEESSSSTPTQLPEVPSAAPATLSQSPDDEEDDESPPPFVPPPPPPMPSAEVDTSAGAYSSLPVVPLDERRYSETIFHTLGGTDLKLKLHLDVAFLEQNFSSMEQPENENRRMSIIGSSSISQNIRDPIMSLSPKLKKAIEIGGRKLQENPMIPEAIKTLNKEKIDTEHVQVLLQMIPKDNNEELKFSSLNDQQCSNLPECYKIMKSLVEIPRLSDKLNALNFLHNFNDAISPIQLKITILEGAINSIKNSEKFRIILQFVLTVVNQFVKNGKEVKGFQIQSLSRLARKRSSKSGMNLLNYIVKQICDSMPMAVNFHDDFEYIDDASKISLKEVGTVLQELDEGIQTVRKEMLATQHDLKDEMTVLTSLTESLSHVDSIVLKHEQVREEWGRAVQNLKALVEFFGMFEVKGEELIEFFHTIAHFVKDFKHALSTNTKLFPQEPKISETTTKKTPKDKDKDQCNRGKFTANSNLNRCMLEDNDQPSEIVNALTSAIASKGFPRSPPRRRSGNEEMTAGNLAQRKRNRKSQSFVIQDNRER